MTTTSDVVVVVVAYMLMLLLMLLLLCMHVRACVRVYYVRVCVCSMCRSNCNPEAPMFLTATIH